MRILLVIGKVNTEQAELTMDLLPLALNDIITLQQRRHRRLYLACNRESRLTYALILRSARAEWNCPRRVPPVIEGTNGIGHGWVTQDRKKGDFHQDKRTEWPASQSTNL